MDIIVCKNCDNQFTGKFCNHCGQTADTNRINHAFVFNDLKKTFIQFNSGFFYTIEKLFLNPGNFVKQYLEGKRIKYSKPFAFLIIACGLNVLLYHFLHVNILVNDIEGIDSQKSNDFLFEYYVQIQLIILPIYAFVSVLFFGSRKYNFFEFVIAHTYLAGQRIMLNLVTIAVEAYFNNPNQIKIIVSINASITYSIMIWAYLRLFKEQSKVKVILKAIAIQLMTFGILVGLTELFLLIIKEMNF